MELAIPYRSPLLRTDGMAQTALVANPFAWQPFDAGVQISAGLVSASYATPTREARDFAPEPTSYSSPILPRVEPAVNESRINTGGENPAEMTTWTLDQALIELFDEAFIDIHVNPMAR